MKDAKVFLIDLDNTLIFGDKKEVVARLFSVSESLRLGINIKTIRRICENNSCIKEMILEIAEQGNIGVDALMERKKEFDGKFDHLLFLGEGVADTLDILKKRGNPLAIVSTRTSSSIPRILKKLGVFDYFDAIVGRDDYKEKKPACDPFEKALADLGLDSKEGVYMIGDRQDEDIAGAVNFGIGSVLVNKELNANFAQPTYHIRKFRELSLLLEDEY